ncbi:hypothetical protein Poly30_54950 [Planctomycetes bacterium Poly30]|uniref:Transmembrane protein n=2 Tax=Saltatorellus ferox TaxID=2528018 RepID=A0A518F0T7_9BACT|nr:hypothetical protein Poly30_54950 [Planctomycetes bacterium Poly30]
MIARKSSLYPMKVLARATWLLGATACLLPWAAHAMGRSPHRQHSDLWIALGLFVLGLTLELLLGHGPRRFARAVLGLLAISIAAANVTTLRESAAHAGQPGVKGFLGDADLQRLAVYAAVSMAGLVLMIVATLDRKRRVS